MQTTPHRRSDVVARCAALLIAALVTATASADDEAPDRPGPYVGIGAFYAPEDFDRAFDDSAGAELRLGWRLLPRLAAELRYEWLEGFDSSGEIAGITDPDLDVEQGDVELDSHQLMLNAKLFALTGCIQPYAVVGMGAQIINTELRDPKYEKPFDVEVGFASRFGAGVDLYATPHVVIELEGAYVVPSGAVRGERYGTLGLGVQYRF